MCFWYGKNQNKNKKAKKLLILDIFQFDGEGQVGKELGGGGGEYPMLPPCVITESLHDRHCTNWQFIWAVNLDY